MTATAPQPTVTHDDRRSPDRPVELTASEAFAAALRGEPCRVIGIGDPTTLLPFRRWCADADAADHELLSRCLDATVDIGCGPGRMTRALLGRGIKALGIDVVPEAVELTRSRGAIALQRDVFAAIPGEGRWQTALLADGNIGIGGDPVRLLRRLVDVLATGGRIVADISDPGGPILVHRIGLEVAGRRTRRFPWAVVPADRLEELAEQSCLRVLELVDHGGRWFATLEKPG